MHLRRIIWLLVVISASVQLMHCESNEFDDRLLEGRVAGEAWTFKYAAANFSGVDNAYNVVFYSTRELADDPCAIVSSPRPHITVQIPNRVGFYTLPFANLSSTLRFVRSSITNQSVTASSGFIEITAVSGTRVAGYMSAMFDDDNRVEGNFIFERCN